MKKFVLLLMLFLTQLGLSQIKVDEYDTRITFNNENYIYSYKHGLILEEDGKFTVIDSNNYGEPFIYENQLILGSAINGYFKLTDEKKLISFDTGFLIDEINSFKIEDVQLIEGYTSCYGSTLYYTDFTKVNPILFKENVSSNHVVISKKPIKVLKTDLDETIKDVVKRLKGIPGNLDAYNFTESQATIFKDKIIFYDSLVIDDTDYFSNNVKYHSNDYDYYKELFRISDSLVNLEPKEVKKIIENDGNAIISTGTHFYKIILTDSEEKNITIYTSDNFTSINFSEWTITIENFDFEFLDISFAEQINEKFNQEFIDLMNISDNQEHFYSAILSEYFRLHSHRPARLF